MPTPAQDLNDKLKLERKLLPKLRAYNRQTVADFTREYAQNGSILNASEFNEDLSEILNEHYTEVTAEFSGRLSRELPTDVEITQDEEDLIAEALLAWILLTTPTSAARINVTTQENMLDAVRLGLDDPTTRELTGREAQRNTAAIAGNDLKRKLAGRETAITMTETQIPAETAKATEAEVLTGVTPSVSGGSAVTAPVPKEWISVGDDIVRDAHLAADGQQVSMNEPFIVGGEALNWPSDASLGASTGNIINCRCGMNVSIEQVVEFRRAA